ncbi:MAG: hypothetical protein RMK49_02765, partial [Abditibacteriales bacterium]|nr:hypothetical protein [Abditibacteriales bacterium]
MRLGMGLLLCLGTVGITHAQTPSGYYSVAQRDGVWWFVAPDGKPFFSLGVNVVDMGTEREKYDPNKPAYAAFRYYPDSAAWAQATLNRLRGWGFNTIGGWSAKEVYHGGLPYTVVLHWGGMTGAPWFDLFSKE